MKFQNPFFPGADPFLLTHEGKYYLYCTDESGLAPDGFLVYQSEDLIQWENKGYCLHKDNVMGQHWFWAPEVSFHNGKFYMVYSAEEHIAVAVADSPLGPFCQTEKRWLREEKAIDSHLFFDDDGTVYLYYVRFDGGNKIFAARMAPDLLEIEEEYDACLIQAEEPWETVDCLVAEGPFVLKHKGLYYLVYSANHTRSKDYAVGYAVSETPAGPFRKFDGNPILHSNSIACGVGHNSFAPTLDGERMLCIYHCHSDFVNFKPRKVCIDYAYFVPQENGSDRLVIDGPTGKEKE